MPSFQKCADFVEREEGVRLQAYRDRASIPTIGVGCTRYQNGMAVKMGDRISLPEARALFEFTLKVFVRAVVNLVKASLNDNQMTAVVSFAYNEGIGAFATSTLLKKININPEDPSIADEFPKWNKLHQNGRLVEDAGLTARRRRERILYFTPVS